MKKVVIELLDYKISKTYTTYENKGLHIHCCYRTIRLQNFKDKEGYFKKMLQRYYFFLKYANEY